MLNQQHTEGVQALARCRLPSTCMPDSLRSSAISLCCYMLKRHSCTWSQRADQACREESLNHTLGKAVRELLPKTVLHTAPCSHTHTSRECTCMHTARMHCCCHDEKSSNFAAPQCEQAAGSTAARRRKAAHQELYQSPMTD